MGSLRDALAEVLRQRNEQRRRVRERVAAKYPRPVAPLTEVRPSRGRSLAIRAVFAVIALAGLVSLIQQMR